MNLKIEKNDPFNVLFSTKSVVENTEFVFINEQNLESFSSLLKKKFKEGQGNNELRRDLENNLKDELLRWTACQDSKSGYLR